MNRDREGVFVLSALWLIIFSASSQLLILSPILPHIAESLAIEETLQGHLFTIFAIFMGLFAVLTGPFSDKYGRRMILAIGSGVMTVALLLHCVAYDFVTLLLYRGLAGIGAGILSGASVSYIGDYYPPEKRGWANGIALTGIAAAQVLGIPLGTILAEWGGFRTPFIMFAFIMLTGFVMVMANIPQPTVNRLRGRLTIVKTFNNYSRLLRQPIILAIMISFTLINLSFAFYVIFLPTWLTDAFRMNGYDIAGIAFIAGLASIWVAPVVGRRSDRNGRKRLIVNACIGLAVVMALTPFLVIDFWTATLVVLLVMALVSARMSPFQALISDLIPEDWRGATFCLANAFGQIGMAIGSALAGLVYMELGFVYNTVLGTIFIVLMALLVWRAIPESGDTSIHEALAVSDESPSRPNTISDTDELTWKKTADMEHLQ